jgi:hypothetical protein
LIDDKIPVFDGFLVEKLCYHSLDSLDLFLWINSRLSKSVTHTWTFSDTVRYTIKKTKLGRQVMTLFSHFDQEHGLVHLCDPFFVAQKEVLGDRDNFILVLKSHRGWVNIEHHICDKVGPLVAPVCNDWLLTELQACNLFKAVLITSTLIFDLHDSLKTTFSRHELKN